MTWINIDLDLCRHMVSRVCHEIWEALVLWTSNMASALVRTRLSAHPRWMKFILCNHHLLDHRMSVKWQSLIQQGKIVFRTIGRLFPRPLVSLRYNEFMSFSNQKGHIHMTLHKQASSPYHRRSLLGSVNNDFSSIYLIYMYHIHIINLGQHW